MFYFKIRFRQSARVTPKYKIINYKMESLIQMDSINRYVDENFDHVYGVLNKYKIIEKYFGFERKYKGPKKDMFKTFVNMFGVVKFSDIKNEIFEKFGKKTFGNKSFGNSFSNSFGNYSKNTSALSKDDEELAKLLQILPYHVIIKHIVDYVDMNIVITCFQDNIVLFKDKGKTVKKIIQPPPSDVWRIDVNEIISGSENEFYGRFKKDATGKVFLVNPHVYVVQPIEIQRKTILVNVPKQTSRIALFNVELNLSHSTQVLKTIRTNSNIVPGDYLKSVTMVEVSTIPFDNILTLWSHAYLPNLEWLRYMSDINGDIQEFSRNVEVVNILTLTSLDIFTSGKVTVSNCKNLQNVNIVSGKFVEVANCKKLNNLRVITKECDISDCTIKNLMLQSRGVVRECEIRLSNWDDYLMIYVYKLYRYGGDDRTMDDFYVKPNTFERFYLFIKNSKSVLLGNTIMDLRFQKCVIEYSELEYPASYFDCEINVLNDIGDRVGVKKSRVQNLSYSFINKVTYVLVDSRIKMGFLWLIPNKKMDNVVFYIGGTSEIYFNDQNNLFTETKVQEKWISTTKELTEIEKKYFI